jgi:LiaI-LiaF-like transmembrane region/B-box zinc finger
MNCANHPTAPVAHYCRTCGKPLCAECSRNVQGVIYCENCLAERLHGVQPGTQPGPQPSGAPAAGLVSQPVAGNVSAVGPHPAVAGILAGFFPFGVGAVYTGQYAKGLAHLVIFTLLIWGTTVANGGGLETILGLGIGFFYVYQIIDAVRSAAAIRMGQPAPDPFGLGQSFGAVERTEGSAGTGKGESSQIPAAAIILIGLGVLFLLGTTGLFDVSFDRIWPFFLIFLGVWLFAKRWGWLKSSRYRCYCDRCKMRGVMGAAVITTVGLISLLSTYGQGWDHTWPLLLIVIGVVKILEGNASTAGHVGLLDRHGRGTGVAVPPPPPGTSVPPTGGGTGSEPSSSEVSHG